MSVSLIVLGYLALVATVGPAGIVMVAVHVALMLAPTLESRKPPEGQQ